MLVGSGLNDRIKECEEQAKAWLEIEETDAAIATLRQLVRSARGIYLEEDYQFIMTPKN
jgi:hypothetical protein